MHEKSGPRLAALLAIAALAFLLAGCSQQPSPATERQLVIYTYDSMASEYGIGPKIIPKFEAACNCNVKMVSKGDAGQVLAALILEKDSPQADVVVGIDNSLAGIAAEKGVLDTFTPKNISIVPQSLRFDKQGYITPFDYGYFAFIYDSNKVKFNLNSFDSMLDSRLEKKIAIQNPRTSSPGLGLLLWSVAVYGDPGYKGFWKKFRPNILTVTAGWDESAGLFASGEVPVYLSYSTSPPYYVQFEKKDNYLAASFNEGHYAQIEGMAIVKGAKHRKLAEDFIEFSLEKEFQDEIPLNQFMFPVNQNVLLPKSYAYAIKPEKALQLDPALVKQKQEEWIFEWEKIMQFG